MFKKLLLCIFCALMSTSQIAYGKFLLLLGPSGAGKSTIIKHLKKIDHRFIYINPYTTRSLRPGEDDKVSISSDEMERLQKNGKLLTVNEIYGIYYATPKAIIDDALADNNFPVLDWPVSKLELMQKNYGEALFIVYVEPDNIEELRRRLSLDTRDKDGQRYQAGQKEMNDLHDGLYDAFIDFRIINKQGCDQEIAQMIYQNFLESME